MRFNDAARVGLTVLIAAALLVVATFTLRGRFGGGGSYVQTVQFPDAQGIQKGAYVRVRGVDLGTVEKIGLAPSGNAQLTLRISNQYRYDPAKDAIRIVGGLLGFSPPYVEITPNGLRQAAATTPDGVPIGESGASTEKLVAQADRLLGNLNGLAERLNRVTEGLAQYAEDPVLRRNLNRTTTNFAKISESGVVIAKNMEQATGSADRLIRSFESTSDRLDSTLRRADSLFAGLRSTSDETRALMRDARGVVRETNTVVKDTGELVKNANTTVQTAGGLVGDTRLFFAANREKLQEVIESLNQSLKQLDGTLTEARSFIADPELRADLKATATNVKDATANLKEISKDVRGLTGDPKVQEDLKATITNLRDASAEAGETFRRIRGVLGGGGAAAKTIGERISDAELRVEGQRTTRSNHTRVNFDATVPWSERTFFRLGFYDFGESNRFTVQGGQALNSKVWARYGLYASRLGVGLDLGNRQRPPLSFNLYGVDPPRLDVTGSIPIGRSFDVTLGVDNIFRRADPVIGLRYRR
jgi:phospholipid/cholesterol/gamma-HCH transport system substrate-binding protein